MPIGKARVAREGKDLSIITYAAMVCKALEAAEQLEREDGLSVEVLDLRSLLPMDDEAIVATVQEDQPGADGRTRTPAPAASPAEITARINELCFEWLDAPVRRVCAHDVPLPLRADRSKTSCCPQTADMVKASRWLAAY